MDEPFQTVDNLMKTQFVCNLETRSLSFVDVDCKVRHSLSAGGPPSASLRLWGLGQPVIRQECRKSLQSNLDYSKNHKDWSTLFDTCTALGS